MSKREKIPKLVSGLGGVYSLKRLSEVIYYKDNNQSLEAFHTLKIFG